MKWQFWIIIALVLLVGVTLFNRRRVMNNLKEIRFSKNFTADEFVVTGTGVENVPGPEDIESLRELAIHILQPLRDAVGKPIRINSGYRSPAVNALVPGSSKTSQHMRGQAADISVQGMTNEQIIAMVRALKLPYDQMIDEQRGSSSWVHLSYNRFASRQRGEWLTRRDPGPGRPNEYELVKTGYA